MSIIYICFIFYIAGWPWPDWRDAVSASSYAERLSEKARSDAREKVLPLPLQLALAFAWW